MLIAKRNSPRHAFTLIEILVVVAIIALLVAILLPSLARARDQAKTLKCLANLKQLGNAMAYYANDSRSGSFLPPFTYPLYPYRFKNNNNTLGTDPYWFQYLPFKYLANQTEVASCPSDSQKGKRPMFQELAGGSAVVPFSYAMNDRLPTPDYTKGLETYHAMFLLGLLKDSRERYSPTKIDMIKSPGSTDYLLETMQHDLMSGDSKWDQFRLDHGSPRTFKGAVGDPSQGTVPDKRRDESTLLFADSHAQRRPFKTIWYGDFTFGTTWLPSDPSGKPAPGKFKSLWYGSPAGDSATGAQILY